MWSFLKRILFRPRSIKDRLMESRGSDDMLMDSIICEVLADCRKSPVVNMRFCEAPSNKPWMEQAAQFVGYAGGFDVPTIPGAPPIREFRDGEVPTEEYGLVAEVSMIPMNIEGHREVYLHRPTNEYVGRIVHHRVH